MEFISPPLIPNFGGEDSAAGGPQRYRKLDDIYAASNEVEFDLEELLFVASEEPTTFTEANEELYIMAQGDGRRDAVYRRQQDMGVGGSPKGAPSYRPQMGLQAQEECTGCCGEEQSTPGGQEICP